MTFLMLSSRDNTDCIAFTSGTRGSQWFDEDRLCVYLRFARHRVDTSKHSSCDFVFRDRFVLFN